MTICKSLSDSFSYLCDIIINLNVIKMETKTKSLRWLLPLLSALFLLSGLTSCDSTEDSVEDPAKPKPEAPIADGDWQVVPATGGTITKDSISITFPSGTFSVD